MSFQLDGYVDVAERIRMFKSLHPQGSLQPANPEEPYKLERIGDRLFIVVIAAAYRTPDDTRPGIGMAMEPYPGRTNYTKDSELMNAETSAWGRAIVAALAADTQKVASAQEVRNRQADRTAPAPVQRANPKMEGAPSLEEAYDPQGDIPFPKETPAKPRAAVGSAARKPAGDSPTLSDPQRNKIRAMWRSMTEDGTAPADKLEDWLAGQLGREITVVNELTKKEATTVIDSLIKLQGGGA